jgi:hypothetical protein
MNTIIKNPSNFKRTLFSIEINKKNARVFIRKAESNSFMFVVLTMPIYQNIPKRPPKIPANKLFKSGEFIVLAILDMMKASNIVITLKIARIFSSFFSSVLLLFIYTTIIEKLLKHTSYYIYQGSGPIKMYFGPDVY